MKEMRGFGNKGIYETGYLKDLHVDRERDREERVRKREATVGEERVREKEE